MKNSLRPAVALLALVRERQDSLDVNSPTVCPASEAMMASRMAGQIHQVKLAASISLHIRYAISLSRGRP